MIIIADSVLGGRAIQAEELVQQPLPELGARGRRHRVAEAPPRAGPTQNAFAVRPRREHAILPRRAARRGRI